MVSHLLPKIFVLAVIALASAVGNTAESKKTTELKEETIFFSDMRSWVHHSLRSAGDTRARYLLQRIGCPAESSADKNEAKAKKKAVVRTVDDDVAQCEKTKKDFFCLATRSLVRDLQIPENKYYYYCQSSTE
jgi:hypothetical protein